MQFYCTLNNMKIVYCISIFAIGVSLFADQNERKKGTDFDITEQLYAQTTLLMETMTNPELAKAKTEGMKFSNGMLQIQGRKHPRLIPISGLLDSLSARFEKSYTSKVASKLLINYGFPANEMERLSLLTAHSVDVCNAILYLLHTDAGIAPNDLRFQEKFSDEEIIHILKKRRQNEKDAGIIWSIAIFESLSKTAQKSLYLYLFDELTEHITQFYHQQNEVTSKDIKDFIKTHSQTRDLSIKVDGNKSIEQYFQDYDLKNKQIISDFEELLGKNLSLEKIKKESADLLDLNHLTLEIPLNYKTYQEINQ